MNLDDLDDEEAGGGLPPFLFDPLGIVRRRWKWMLPALLAAVAATLVIGVNLKPRYRAGATVMVATTEIPEEFVRSTVREDPFQRINAMVGEILARANLTAMIEQHDLYAERSDAEGMEELVQRMRDDISIDTKDGIGDAANFETARLLVIEFEHEDPQVAAAVANDLADLFSKASVRLRSRQAALTTEFMKRELARSEAELREHDRKITEFKTTHRGELPADLEPSLRALARYQDQRQSLALQIAETESRLAVLSTDETSPDARLEVLRGELSRELAGKTEKHPTVVELRQQIANLEREVASTTARGGGSSALAAAAHRTLAEQRRQRVLTDEKIRELEERVARIPARQEELGALEEKQSVLQATYTDFLRKVQEAGLAQSLEQAQHGARVSILEPAEPPVEPTKSQRAVFGIGALAAVALAFGVGALLELLYPVLLMRREAKSVEGVPVLGTVPWIS